MSDIGSTYSEQSDWKYLGKELVRRTRRPLKDFPFVVYVFLGVVLFGGLGVWVEILKIIISKACEIDYAGLVTAVNTFFPALIGAATLQLVLASANRSDKILMSFGLLFFCIFFAIAILMPFFSSDHPGRVLAIGFFSSACAVWVWWITNFDDPTFKKMTRPDSSTGGPVEKPLAGDLAAFKV